MNTPKNREPATRTQTLQSREQRILSEIDRLFRDPDFQAHFQSVALTSFQGLVQRSGLLQTVFFARGKSKTQGWTQALEVISTVLHALWPDESLFSPGENPKFQCLDPMALGKQDLISYQRLQLEALEVAGLTARYAEAWNEIRLNQAAQVPKAPQNPPGGAQ